MLFSSKVLQMALNFVHLHRNVYQLLYNSQADIFPTEPLKRGGKKNPTEQRNAREETNEDSPDSKSADREQSGPAAPLIVRRYERVAQLRSDRPHPNRARAPGAAAAAADAGKARSFAPGEPEAQLRAADRAGEADRVLAGKRTRRARRLTAEVGARGGRSGELRGQASRRH